LKKYLLDTNIAVGADLQSAPLNQGIFNPDIKALSTEYIQSRFGEYEIYGAIQMPNAIMPKCQIRTLRTLRKIHI